MTDDTPLKRPPGRPRTGQTPVAERQRQSAERLRRPLLAPVNDRCEPIRYRNHEPRARLAQ